MVSSPQMHELSLMNNLIQHAVAAANGAPVCGLRVRVGPLSGVVIESLRFAFDALAPDHLAPDAFLHIEETRPTFRCRDCGTHFQQPVGTYNCPTCHSATGELIGGNELELISIEVPNHV